MVRTTQPNGTSNNPNLGATIRAARHQLGISIEEIERTTKIKAEYLRLIEEGQFERLPEGLQGQAFILQMGRAVGVEVDPNGLVSHQPKLKLTTPSRFNLSPWLGLGVVLIAAVVVFLVWAVYH
jgi:transcriptional regulator with XRE-family HTH domain